MTPSELKIALIKKLLDIDDFATLEKLHVLLHKELHFLSEPDTAYEKSEKFYELNEWQQLKLEKALKQYEKGECITDEEADNEILQWIEE